jgi:hypothetical protein
MSPYCPLTSLAPRLLHSPFLNSMSVSVPGDQPAMIMNMMRMRVFLNSAHAWISLFGPRSVSLVLPSLALPVCCFTLSGCPPLSLSSYLASALCSSHHPPPLPGPRPLLPRCTPTRPDLLCVCVCVCIHRNPSLPLLLTLIVPSLSLPLHPHLHVDFLKHHPPPHFIHTLSLYPPRKDGQPVLPAQQGTIATY